MSLVGVELGVSDWVLVDQGRINAFAEVTGDHQWIHVDVERAEREIGGTIAHGFLTLSLMAGLSPSILEIDGVSRALNYGFEKLRFLSPVPAGSRVRLRETMTSVESKAGGLALTRACTMDIEDATKPALVCDWIGIVYP
jgi:acyl dehydratase